MIFAADKRACYETVQNMIFANYGSSSLFPNGYCSPLGKATLAIPKNKRTISAVLGAKVPEFSTCSALGAAPPPL
jgi:hypothetical protein